VYYISTCATLVKQSLYKVLLYYYSTDAVILILSVPH